MASAPMTTMTVLLGEAPKLSSGFGFHPEAFTTQQIALSIGIAPERIHEHFWVMNVFDEPQQSDGRGFDSFSTREAVDVLRDTFFPNRRIVCVGTRVARALAIALGVDDIPESEFRAFYPRHRRADWLLGYIVHPSGCSGPPDKYGRILPGHAQAFLRAAAGMRG